MKKTLGATAMAPVCNVSAEVGSTSFIFPYWAALTIAYTRSRSDGSSPAGSALNHARRLSL
jgi:aconitate hydratase